MITAESLIVASMAVIIVCTMVGAHAKTERVVYRASLLCAYAGVAAVVALAVEFGLVVP